jgi:predicted Zn-dependent protease
VKDLIRSKQDTIELTYNDSVFSIATKQLREINFIFQSICARAEQSASLWIESGLAPNASAKGLGSNRITINFGMISMIGDNQAEWAALIGHEVAHLKLEHSKAGLKRKVPLELARGLINEKVENRTLSTLLGLTTQAIDSHYSQKQENDSDYLGAIWAVEAGYSAWGAAGLHSKLLAIKPGNNYPEFLRSHPSSEKRVERLGTLAERLDAQ